MPVIMFVFFMGFYYVKMRGLMIVDVFKIKFFKDKLDKLEEEKVD